MSKFTPGPWEVVKHERFPCLREVKSEVAYICDMEGLGADDMPTVDANASLIAAAPDMFAKLIELRDSMNCVCRINKIVAPLGAGISCIHCELDDLIAKADEKPTQSPAPNQPASPREP